MLMRLLADTGESIAELKQRAQALVRRQTFGNIAFEHWMAEEPDRPKLDRVPAKEPDWLCLDCNANHKWNEICPRVVAETKALRP